MEISECDKKRLAEIDDELEKIHKLFTEYHSWYDEKTHIVWFPPGRNFNYDEVVDLEYQLLTERRVIKGRLSSESA